MNQAIRTKFESYPIEVRPKLEFLRDLILDVAQNAALVGDIEETLKWGEPAFTTLPTWLDTKTGGRKKVKASGTTIRIDWKPKTPHQYAIYVNCKTNLIDAYNSLFPGVFVFQGSRALVFELEQTLPVEELRICIHMALTYHLKT
jgi:hypothetical protein